MCPGCTLELLPALQHIQTQTGGTGHASLSRWSGKVSKGAPVFLNQCFGCLANTPHSHHLCLLEHVSSLSWFSRTSLSY